MYFLNKFQYNNLVKSLKRKNKIMVLDNKILDNKKGCHLKRKLSGYLKNIVSQNETDRKIKAKQNHSQRLHR